MNKKEEDQCCELKAPQVPLELRNKLKIECLERRVKQLETSVRILDVIALQYAKANGIKIERFQDLVIISQV